MRNWLNLSDHEFEVVAGDLLGVKLGRRFERTPRGPDGGIDLRSPDGAADLVVLQAKHYCGSTWSQLKSAVKAEAKRLPFMQPQPSSYWLITSFPLTTKRREELTAILSVSPVRSDVLGREELETLLDEHPEVEKRNIKLALASSAAFSAIVHADVHARSQRLMREIKRQLPLWVQNDAFADAAELLNDQHVCVIAGPPGIGKTTLAHMLVAYAIDRGYAPIEVSADIDEAWRVVNDDAKQIFLYDDFLGQTTLDDLAKNEDGRLAAFMDRLTEGESGLLVMTTREHILQRAVARFEKLKRAGTANERLLLTLASYRPIDRGAILSNHVWHSPILGVPEAEQLSQESSYRRIIDHVNFSPRLIEYITGTRPGFRLSQAPDERWIDVAVAALDRPTEIWRNAWVNQLDDAERLLLTLVATLPAEIVLEDLHVAYEAVRMLDRDTKSSPFEDALRVVADTWVSTDRRADRIIVTIASPGILDFVNMEIRRSENLTRRLVQSARFFEQLTALWRIGRSEPDCPACRALLDDETTVIAGRLFGLASPNWTVTESDDGGEIMRRRARTPEERLAAIRPLAVACDGRALYRWWEQHVADCVANWRKGIGKPKIAIVLARDLLGSDLAREDGWPQAFGEFVLNCSASLGDWECASELRTLAPQTYSAELWRATQQRFSLWATETLQGGRRDEANDEAAIVRLDVCAESLEVKLDPELVRTAVERVTAGSSAERLNRFLHTVFGFEEPPRTGESQDEVQEIDAMFDRLARESAASRAERRQGLCAE